MREIMSGVIGMLNPELATRVLAQGIGRERARNGLERLLELQFDVLSLDVFDTAITRTVECPVDVFAIAEERLVAELGSVARGYAELRETAEEQSRTILRNIGKEEVGHADILRQIAARRPELSKHVPLLHTTELACELEVARPVPAIAELYRSAQRLNRRVIFVSDMYLRAADIARLLKHCGYDSSAGLIVSSETGATKATGRQWDYVRAHVGRTGRIIHVGDDSWSDVGSPSRHGVIGHHFDAARSDRRIGGPLRPPVLPVSKLARGERLKSGTIALPRDEFMRSLGRSFGVTVVGAFLRWLETRLQFLGVTHLAFCARDGWLLQRAFEAAGCAKRLSIESCYLYVSRRTLNLGHAGIPSVDRKLSSAALDRLTETSGDVDHFLKRGGLSGCDALQRELRKAFGSTVIRLEKRQQLRALLQQNAHEVLAALEPMRASTTGYLAQELPDSGRVGLVDLGWRGTSQSCLNQLLRQAPMYPQVFGFYYGLWPEAQHFRPSAGWMECAFGSDFRPREEQLGLANAPGLLENLHCGPHGTTVGYRRDGGKWTPELRQSAAEMQLHAELIAPFQDAVVAAVAELFETERYGPVRLHELTPQAGLAAIERLALSPTPQELEHIGSIRHSIDASHSVFRPLADAAQRWPLETDWPVGSALVLREEGTANSDDRIETVRRSVDPRTARLFQ
jgi:predicted HAD superfamily hydrolase